MLLLLFAVALVVAVLLSEIASRSILSTAALFLLTGVTASFVGAIGIEATDDWVVRLAEIALFATLYTDAMRVGVRDLVNAWRLPGRALLLGMPLVVLGTAGLAFLLVGLTWEQALLVGAVLAPTDPVLASAIIGREAVPGRLRFLLGVESGLNDGLALPAVLLILAALGAGRAAPVQLAEELGIGVAIGVAVPWLVVRVARIRGLGAVGAYEQLLGFAIGITVFAVAELTHGNLLLAAFVAGVTVRTTGPEIRETFHRFGEVGVELLKLLGLLVFGALLQPTDLTDLPAGAWVLAVLTLVAIRPGAIGLSMIRSRLGQAERLAAAWFGPKGFASVLYGLLVLQSGVPDARLLFTVIAVVIAVSILAHSSTDVAVARWFARRADDEQQRREREPRRGRDPEQERAERYAEEHGAGRRSGPPADR